jgi:hypothetical protein
MPTIELVLPEHHPAQAQIVEEAEGYRYKVLACGRRFGKSKLFQRLAAEPALDGFPVGYFAPDYKRLSEYWDELKAMLLPVTAQKSETLHKLMLNTGGSIECWTLEDEDAGRSRKYARVIVDEAGMVPDLGKRWGKAIRATLMDLKGDAWFGGTPKGMNFFWQVFERGQARDRGQWIAWQMPSDANPYLSRAELEEIKADLTEREIDQEIDAKFLADGGGVFRKVRQACCLKPAAPIRGHQYVAGLDWARSGDWTVLSVYDVTSRPVRQVCLERFRDIGWTIQSARVLGTMKRYGWPTTWADRTGIGSKPCEDLLEAGADLFAIDTTNGRKMTWVGHFAHALETGDVLLLDDEDQRTELMAYEEKRLPSGALRYEAPEGLHDDIVAADIMGWQPARFDKGGPDSEPEDRREDEAHAERMKLVRGHEDVLPRGLYGG